MGGAGHCPAIPRATCPIVGARADRMQCSSECDSQQGPRLRYNDVDALRCVAVSFRPKISRCIQDSPHCTEPNRRGAMACICDCDVAFHWSIVYILGSILRVGRWAATLCRYQNSREHNSRRQMPLAQIANRNAGFAWFVLEAPTSVS